jgi:transketolase
MIDAARRDSLRDKALEIRRSIIEMVYLAKSGHIGGSLGAADILVALYYQVMRHDPREPRWPGRDRFLLSKGHCTPVLYAVLADCGYFPKDDLLSFRRPGSHLQGHPYQPNTPGVDASTGTLGLGISTGCGMALAAKLRQQPHRIFVLCGDGELQEGQVWEAAMFAAKYQLDNLIAFVDRNYLQTDGHSEQIMPLDPLAEKWRAFGWEAQEIDGHDFGQIVAAVQHAESAPGRPHVVVARTVKGKGVAFMENDNQWHGRPPDRNEYERAMRELGDGA